MRCPAFSIGWPVMLIKPVAMNINGLKRVAVAAASVLLLFSCRGGNEGLKNPDEGFVNYIEAYTGGLVSTGSAVRIEFASTPDTSVPADGLLSFSPSLKGQTRWDGARAIEFVPDEGQLKGGREYRGRFALDKVFGVEKAELRTFEFSFRVAPKRASLAIDNVRIQKNAPSEAAVSGRLFLSEGSLAAEDVAALLYAEGASGAAKVSVAGTSAAGTYDFTLSPVPRGGADSKVTVAFDGHSAGFGETVSADVTIPGTEGFRVLSAKLRDGSEPYVEVVLSQPLDPLADLSGMFVLSVGGRTRISSQGNIVRAAFEKKAAGEDISLTVSSLLKDWKGERLGSDWTADFKSSELKPAVRLLQEGNILPDPSALRLPFQAVNLRAVDIKVVKIYSDNVLHFLQDNNLGGGDELRRSGRLVYKRTLSLDSNPSTDLHQWQNFSVDLSSLMKREIGAIYRVIFSFTQDYSVYGKNLASASSASSALTKLSDGQMSEDDEAVWDIPETYYYDNLYDWDKYDWRERNNPMNPTYYMQSERFPSVNLMSSNLGVVAKSGEKGKLAVYVNDILSSAPLSGVEVTAYNFQLRPLASAKTGSDGSAVLSFDGKAFVVKASSADAVSYLKVVDGQENSLSRFDVGGETVEKGLRGFVYGERGVWRPGDTLHLTLLVESPDKALPAVHPAVIEIYGPQGQLFAREVCPKSTDGFYCFGIPTSADDPTGVYHAYAKIGGAAFHKALHIETIKPNRLKINLELPSDGVISAGESETFRIESSYLTGSAASGLKTRSSMRLTPRTSAFKGFEGYVFTNPLSEFKSQEVEIFSTQLDSRGKASPSVRVSEVPDAPGMLNAAVVTRVAEPGGNESIISQNALYSPFKAYVGVDIPSGKEGFLETGKDWKIRTCAVDASGARVAGHRLEYRIFRIDSRWWWERGDGQSLASYVRGSSAKEYSSGQLTSSSSSDSEIRFRLDDPDWGRFLVYVTDLDSGHSSGGIFVCDSPRWRGRADHGDGTSASMLSFSLDRKSYSVGEEALVYLPAAKGARALVSIEKDSRQISSTWVKLSESEETAYRIKTTSEMFPNCYVHVTLLNPYARTSEGQPLRMYGVHPLFVSDPSSHLEPVMKLPDSLRPQEEFEIRVKEKSGKPMSYTLAIVDEGLLDLTAFRTPDPWEAMNRRTALGVKTWDIFNNVVGACGSSFASMFSIGGDEDFRVDGTVRDNRFSPVVEFLGPFTLRRGENVHKVKLPMYVGSVRVMLVAAHEGAYGSAEKAVPVRAPLMILPTLPRTLSCGEKVKLPVNVFAMDASVRDVQVSVSSEGALKLDGSSSKPLTFSSTGDKLVDFSFVSGVAEGVAKVTVRAKSGNFTAEETLSIDVRNANPYVQSVDRRVLQPGESCTFDCAGAEGTVEVSTFPSIDLGGVWSYMKFYPHNCTEQICAKGITLLSILPQLDEQRRTEAGETISSILSELYTRQLSDGNFVYWKGWPGINLWADAMAGHFLSLASNEGYAVDGGVFSLWRNKVKNYVNSYRTAGNEYDALSAYCLYVLALSGNAQDGAMNRMKEASVLPDAARNLLASAYSVSGRPQISRSILSDGNGNRQEDYSDSQFFGSALRDDAISLEAQTLAGNLSQAMELAGRVAEGFARQYYTTQTTAFASVALSRLYALSDKEGMSFLYESSFGNEGANSENVKSVNALWSRNIADGATSLKLTNSSKGILYVGLSTRCVLPSGTPVQAASAGISLNVVYKDLDGNSLAPSALVQGTDFIAEYTVRNVSVSPVRNLALSAKVPSGWEIFNSRLFAGEGESATGAYTACDIRDSEVLWYFDLPRGAVKTFTLRLSAAYLGEFILPSASCEAMYDNSVFARTASGTATVVVEK